MGEQGEGGVTVGREGYRCCGCTVTKVCHSVLREGRKEVLELKDER